MKLNMQSTLGEGVLGQRPGFKEISVREMGLLVQRELVSLFNMVDVHQNMSSSGHSLYV